MSSRGAWKEGCKSRTDGRHFFVAALQGCLMSLALGQAGWLRLTVLWLELGWAVGSGG